MALYFIIRDLIAKIPGNSYNLKLFIAELSQYFMAI